MIGTEGQDRHVGVFDSQLRDQLQPLAAVGVERNDDDVWVGLVDDIEESREAVYLMEFAGQCGGKVEPEAVHVHFLYPVAETIHYHF